MKASECGRVVLISASMYNVGCGVIIVTVIKAYVYQKAL